MMVTAVMILMVVMMMVMLMMIAEVMAMLVVFYIAFGEWFDALLWSVLATAPP